MTNHLSGQNQIAIILMDWFTKLFLNDIIVMKEQKFKPLKC